ncbi:MAG: hypothetical protein AB1563_00030 [Bacillota bacterium]
MGFNKLANLDVSEISLVDRAANKRRFLFFKARGGDEKVGRKVVELDLEDEMDEEESVSEEIEKAVDEKKLKSAVQALVAALAQTEIPDKAAKALKQLTKLLGLDAEEYGYGYPEPQKTKTEKSLLDRIKALVFQHETESVKKAAEFEAAMAAQETTQDISSAIWLLQDTIRGILQDEEGNKVERIKANVAAFQDYVTGLLEREGVQKAREALEKAGRKISAARLAKLKETHQNLVNLAAALAELIQEAEIIGTEEEDATVTKEELEKFKTEELAPAVNEAVQKALGPLEERIAKLEKAQEEKNLEETIKKALEPLAARVETIEKARAASQSIPNEAPPASKGTFTGVLFGRK